MAAAAVVVDRSSKPHGNQVNRAKSTSTCFDCGLPRTLEGRQGSAPNLRFGAGLGRKDAKRGGGKQVMISEPMDTECLIPSSLSPDEHAEPHEVHAVASAHVPLNASLSEALRPLRWRMHLRGRHPSLSFLLKDATYLRNRMGFEMAFMEDPLLAGMLAARASKGISHWIQSVALMEAKEEAKKAKDAGKQQIAVRELVGPRGGLPTLCQDLLKLAALLHLDVSEKDNNAMLREKCRPAVDLLMESMPKSAKAKAEAKSSSRSSQEQAPPSTGRRTCSGMARSSSYSARISCSIPSPACAAFDGRASGQVPRMLSQLFQHVMAMQNNQMMPSLSSGPPDASMEN